MCGWSEGSDWRTEEKWKQTIKLILTDTKSTITVKQKRNSCAVHHSSSAVSLI